jgi:hypothetical protein
VVVAAIHSFKTSLIAPLLHESNSRQAAIGQAVLHFGLRLPSSTTTHTFAVWTVLSFPNQFGWHSQMHW